MFPRAIIPQNKHTFFFYPRLRRKYPQRPAPLLITIRDDNFSWSSSINSIFLFIALWSLYFFGDLIHILKKPDRSFSEFNFFFKKNVAWLCIFLVVIWKENKICDWVWQKHKWILFVLILKPGSKNAHLFVSLALVETFGTTNSMKNSKR